MAFVRVAAEDTLWEGELLEVTVHERLLLLAHVNGEIRAYEGRCLHRGVPLVRGRLAGHELTCSTHEWCYDLRSGRGVNPRQVQLRTFPVEVRDGHIWVDVPEAGGG